MIQKTFLLVCYYLLSFLVIAQPAARNDIDNFLSSKAVKTDLGEVQKSINRFLNYETDKGEVVWFKGSIQAVDEEYINVDLNFNVLNNSLYVLRKNQVYRISNFAIEGFNINQKGKSLIFKKGYAVAFGARIVAISSGSTQEFINYITTYPDFNDLQIRDISISEGQKTELEIKLNTGFRDQISGLKKYIDKYDMIESSESTFNVSELGVNKYLQVLYEHEKFHVLKYHFKRSASAESLSLVNSESSSMVFDDEDYFIADTNKELNEFLFTKNSIEKALESIEVSYVKKVKKVGSERKTIAWFNNNTFQ